MIYERAITLLSGRYGGRAAPQAYLEFAQEHFLAWMAAEGLFDGDHPLIFKGGRHSGSSSSDSPVGSALTSTSPPRASTTPSTSLIAWRKASPSRASPSI